MVSYPSSARTPCSRSRARISASSNGSRASAEPALTRRRGHIGRGWRRVGRLHNVDGGQRTRPDDPRRPCPQGSGIEPQSHVPDRTADRRRRDLHLVARSRHPVVGQGQRVPPPPERARRQRTVRVPSRRLQLTKQSRTCVVKRAARDTTRVNSDRRMTRRVLHPLLDPHCFVQYLAGAGAAMPSLAAATSRLPGWSDQPHTTS